MSEDAVNAVAWAIALAIGAAIWWLGSLIFANWWSEAVGIGVGGLVALWLAHWWHMSRPEA